MRSRLPIISIAGTAFYMDVQAEAFIEYNNAQNRICFCQLIKNEQGYTLLFNTETKNVYYGPVSPLPEQVIAVALPPIARLDPLGLAEKYNKAYPLFRDAKNDSQWLSEPGIKSKLHYLN